MIDDILPSLRFPRMSADYLADVVRLFCLVSSVPILGAQHAAVQCTLNTNQNSTSLRTRTHCINANTMIYERK